MCLSTDSVKLTKEIKTAYATAEKQRQKEIKEKEKELKSLETKLEKANEAVSAAEAEVDELSGLVDEASDELCALEDGDDFEVVLSGKDKKSLLSKVVQVAKEDITCWKVFENNNGKLVTPYQNHPWPKTKLVKVSEFGATIEVDDDEGSASMNIHEGLHAYTQAKKDEGSIYPSYTQVVMEMVIPKGTKYILNFNETEIVALAMKIKPIKMAKTPGKTAKKTAKKAAKKKK